MMSHHLTGGSRPMSGGFGLYGTKRHREPALRLQCFNPLKPKEVIGVVVGG
jgi:hypothetical protein